MSKDKVIGIEYEVKITKDKKVAKLRLYGETYVEEWVESDINTCENSISKQLDDKGYSDEIIDLFEELEEEIDDAERAAEIVEEMEYMLSDGCEN